MEGYKERNDISPIINNVLKGIWNGQKNYERNLEIEELKEGLERSKEWLEKLKTKENKNEIQEIENKSAIETANLQIYYMSKAIKELESCQI